MDLSEQSTIEVVINNPPTSYTGEIWVAIIGGLFLIVVTLITLKVKSGSNKLPS